MTDFHLRLVSERKRLDLNQADFGALGGVTKDSQLNYEKGTRRPDSAYLEAIAAHGVDVGYLLTGSRALVMRTYTTSVESTAVVATEAAPKEGQRKDLIARFVTPEEAALLDNYEASDEEGQAAARRVLFSLAKQKAS